MKKISAYILIIFFAATACTERIDLTLDETYTRLVVDGEISNDTAAYRVYLSKTADYFYNEPTPRVVNASVSVYDGAITYPLFETEPGKSGIYETDSTFAGTIGQTYTLNIELDTEVDKRKNYSSSCRMKNVPHLDSIRVDFQTDWSEEGIWEIKVFAQEPGDEENYYMFHYYRNDKLMTDSIWKISYTDDSFINGSYINGVTVIYINNENYWETLHPGDKVTLQMSGITKEYYDFLYQVQIAGYNIPIFMGPPANVVGNISDGAIGFFSAYSNSWSSTIVK